jgi:hypothetical protein
VNFENAHELDQVREQVGLSRAELFVRYFALGGMMDRRTVEAFLDGRTQDLERVDYDMLVHALNERFLELGLDHPVPYSGL